MSYNDLILLNIHYGENISQGTTRFKVKVWFCLCAHFAGPWLLAEMAGELVKWGRLWSEAGECLSPERGRDHGLLGQRVSPSLALPDHVPPLRLPLPFPCKGSGGSWGLLTWLLLGVAAAVLSVLCCLPLRALLPPSRAWWASVSWQMSQPCLLGVRLWGADREPCAEVPLSLTVAPKQVLRSLSGKHHPLPALPRCSWVSALTDPRIRLTVINTGMTS